MYIYLDFFKDFACRMCGECCRSDWMVTLDKASYDRNHSLFSSTGRQEEFLKAFRVLDREQGFGEYACINKQPDGACWFLAEDQHCRLHREAGHEHLDSVCRIFPRYPVASTRGLELTLSLSCPAALERACREKPLAIVRSEEPPAFITDEECVAAVFPRQKPQQDVLRFYFELEQHLLDVVQCRALPLKERMRLLAATIRRLTERGDEETVSGTIDRIFRDNYEMMDRQAEAGRVPAYAAADYLIENLLVNTIFKKIFYLYGLSRANVLLQRIWQQTDEVRARTNGALQLACVKAAVRQIEFRYGHDRRAWEGMVRE